MRRGRGQSDLFANPVLIGAVTVLVAVVGVVLAYNANNGLPFVPTYKVTATVPDAAQLTAGNEVRIGGKRVGVVEGIEAQVSAAGTPTADLRLKLDKVVQPLPADTEVTVRPRSTLGLKYLELRPGRSRQGIDPGGRIPVDRAQPIVELDEVINAFDAPTREGLRGVVRELGNGLAGRGEDLNRAIAAAPPLVTRLERVARNLAAPRTDLRGLVRGLAATTAAVAPVADQLGGLVDGAAVTLGAIAAADGALDEIFDLAPQTIAVATRAARTLRPVLTDAAALVSDLRPGVALLPVAATRLAAAVETGTPVLGRAIVLGDRLGETLEALDALFRNPATGGAVRKLTAVVASLGPTLRFVNPFQVQCNYLGLWTRNASSVISEGDQNGNWFRFIAIVKPDEALQQSAPVADLHANPYPHAGIEGECEAGREPYLPGQHIGNVPGNQGAATELTAPPAGVGRP